MIKARSGTTAQLVQLCLGYFVTYLLTGILVKYFTVVRSPKMSEMGYIFNNTLGGSAFPLLVVLLLPVVGFVDGRGITASAALGLSASAVQGSVDFIHSAPALVILGLYITAYAFRIYIMNYYKNTRGRGVELDNRGFFAVEQIAACVGMVAIGGFFDMSPGLLGFRDQRILDFSGAALHPELSAILAG